LQSAQADDDLVNFLAHVEAKVECDLIVAAAGGVQFCPGRPDPFRQRRLDVHVDIFERLVPNEFAVRDFSFDLAQPRAITSNSLADKIPAAARAEAWAMDPAISWR
jgi:hypothetical protein